MERIIDDPSIAQVIYNRAFDFLCGCSFKQSQIERLKRNFMINYVDAEQIGI